MEGVDVDQARQKMLGRLDTMAGILMPRVEAGELEAMDRLLEVDKLRARLLGLYAPRKLEVTGELLLVADGCESLKDLLPARMRLTVQ